jgi:hypothetical protein
MRALDLGKDSPLPRLVALASLLSRGARHRHRGRCQLQIGNDTKAQPFTLYADGIDVH